MKRLLTIPLLFIYLTAVSGVMINLHYCGAQLDSWNLYVDNNGCDDGECGDESEQNDSCCKDKVVTAKVSTDQNVAKILDLKLVQYELAMPPQVFGCGHEANHCICATKTLVYSPNAPPGMWQDMPAYILYSNLTYYG